MNDKETLSQQIKRHEGFRPKPYRCPAGVLTIGYGFTSLAKDEADAVLKIKLRKLQKTLETIDWFSELSPSRREVILNMVYNLGYPRFEKFKKMLSAIKRQDWNAAADEMLDSKWARKDVGARAIELAEIMRGEEASLSGTKKRR